MCDVGRVVFQCTQFFHFFVVIELLRQCFVLYFGFLAVRHVVS